MCQWPVSFKNQWAIFGIYGPLPKFNVRKTFNHIESNHLMLQNGLFLFETYVMKICMFSVKPWYTYVA